MVSVFLTGATGFIGGEALYQLLSHGGFEVRALVRSEAKADILKKATGDKVVPVLGDLDSLDLLKEEVRKADVIINTANVDHEPSAAVIAEELLKKTTKTILVHTSGTSVLGDGLSATKGPTLKVYSDVKDIDEINSLDDAQPHRPVDKIVLDIEEKNPHVSTVIIAPLCIFGKSDGYDRRFSIQIPFMSAVAKKNNRPFTVYSGNYIWSRVHIKDLGDLYWLLLEKLLKGEKIPTGKKGYYFGAYVSDKPVTEKPDPIEQTWRSISVQVGKILKAKGEIDSDEVQELGEKEVAEISGDPFGPYYWGTNSRSRADNGYLQGWKPKYLDEKTFWDSIEDDVEFALGRTK